MSNLNKLANKNFLSSLSMSSQEVTNILEIAENFKREYIAINDTNAGINN